MALLSTDERNINSFLINQTSVLNPGPGQYDSNVPSSLLTKLEKNKQKLKQQAAALKPPFGKREDRENPSFITPSYSPGPGHYQKPPTFDNKIVAKDAEKGVYFVLEKGSLHRKHEWLAADKSKRMGETLGLTGSNIEPGPG